MGYLIDTNVLSELRKQENCNKAVKAWFETVGDEEIFLSVLCIGEIQKGIGLLRRRDAQQADKLEVWLTELLDKYKNRILVVTTEIAQIWGEFSVPDPISVVDGLLAATAYVHDLTFVTRNIKDVERTGVSMINPFNQS